jgi:dolichyl-phosphate-mannose--protein O-mannosyl transferase
MDMDRPDPEPRPPDAVRAIVAEEGRGETSEQPIRGERARRHARRRRWRVPPLLAIAVVTALAGGLRFYHLSAPQALVFDEVYYAKDGCLDAGYDFKECKLESPVEQTLTVHPPLGRWIIAGSEIAFGNRPFGWRFASAVAGTLSVALAGFLALRLFGSAVWAASASLLLATENLNFVQSRISMFDIFLAVFVLAGFLFVALDRQWIDRRTPEPSDLQQEEAEAALLNLPPDRPPSPIFRPWRLAAGMAFGAACATKWSGIPALGGAILLSLVWERSRRKRFHLSHRWREALRDESFGLFWFIVMVPFAVYMASYASWFVDHGLDWSGWWRLQGGMASYSIHLRAGHPYSSRPWTWLVMSRPVAYFYACSKATTPCRPAEILGMGNPVIFWGALITIPYTVYAGTIRRDWRASLLVVAFASQYFAWFLAARTSFLFYMTPITPFLVLAWVYTLKDISDAHVGREGKGVLAPIAGFIIFASVALFVFFLPILTGRRISMAAWHARIWFKGWI